jgi:hypothetical protein
MLGTFPGMAGEEAPVTSVRRTVPPVESAVRRGTAADARGRRAAAPGTGRATAAPRLRAARGLG